MASGPTALVMCIYRRPHLLERTLRGLRAQSRRADRVVLVNNNPQIREFVDGTVGGQAEVVHNPGNEGGWARFLQARRLGQEGMGRVVFIDDDMSLGPDFVASLCDDYREDGLVGPYAFTFRPPFDDYWAKSRVPVGAEAHYIGTCGMIVPLGVFEGPGIEACPARLRMGMEDLWLSAYCRDGLGMRLVRSRAVLCTPEGNDGQATWRPLRAAKSQMLQWLHATMGFPRPPYAPPYAPSAAMAVRPAKERNMELVSHQPSTDGPREQQTGLRPARGDTRDTPRLGVARQTKSDGPPESLLVCSLLPEYFGRRSEDRNLAALVEEYQAGFAGKYRMKLLLGSAHPQALVQAAGLLNGHGVDLETVQLPYVHHPEFNARRPHEISFCKQELARRVRASEYGIVLFIDADIRISFGDVDRLAASLATPRAFVNIPYVIHRSLEAPPIQLGAYMHRKELLDEIDYTGSIYRTESRGGRTYRTDAPDCAVRTHLLGCGAVEVRAQPPEFRITTRHYSDDGSYGLYRAGRMTRHTIGCGQIGFDPVADSMAMEPESCAFLAELCRRTGSRTALDLGTGMGNSLRSLMAGGVRDIVSVDDDERWAAFMKDQDLRFEGNIEFLTCPIVPRQGVFSYDLSALRDRRFDIVVIDGPKANAPGRVAAAMAVDASRYVFHDGIRDAAAVSAFVDSQRLKGRQCDVASFTGGRGMTRVCIGSSGPAPG
jgi:hypothetical protein